MIGSKRIACPDCSGVYHWVHLTAALDEWPGTRLGTVYECRTCGAQFTGGERLGLIVDAITLERNSQP